MPIRPTNNKDYSRMSKNRHYAINFLKKEREGYLLTRGRLFLRWSNPASTKSPLPGHVIDSNY